MLVVVGEGREGVQKFGCLLGPKSFDQQIMWLSYLLICASFSDHLIYVLFCPILPLLVHSWFIDLSCHLPSSKVQAMSMLMNDTKTLLSPKKACQNPTFWQCIFQPCLFQVEWQLRKANHENNCWHSDLTIKSDTGRHLQFLLCIQYMQLSHYFLTFGCNFSSKTLPEAQRTQGIESES